MTASLCISEALISLLATLLVRPISYDLLGSLAFSKALLLQYLIMSTLVVILLESL